MQLLPGEDSNRSRTESNAIAPNFQLGGAIGRNDSLVNMDAGRSASTALAAHCPPREGTADDKFIGRVRYLGGNAARSTIADAT